MSVPVSTDAVSPCHGHTAYGSTELAGNATTLHRLAYPSCEGIHVWSCGDHWHIGHESAGIGQRCKQNVEHRATQHRIRRALGSLTKRR